MDNAIKTEKYEVIDHFLYCIWWLNKQSFVFNPFNPSQLSTPNFSLHNTYEVRHLLMRKWELIKQSKLLKIKNKILSNLFNGKYELKLGEFTNTTGTERVKFSQLEKPRHSSSSSLERIRTHFKTLKMLPVYKSRSIFGANLVSTYSPENTVCHSNILFLTRVVLGGDHQML